MIPKLTVTIRFIFLLLHTLSHFDLFVITFLKQVKLNYISFVFIFIVLVAISIGLQNDINKNFSQPGIIDLLIMVFFFSRKVLT